MEIRESKEKIRIRAHQLWEQAGRPHGHDVDHWLQAEREMLLNSAAAAPLAEEVRHEAPIVEPARKPADCPQPGNLNRIVAARAGR